MKRFWILMIVTSAAATLTITACLGASEETEDDGLTLDDDDDSGDGDGIDDGSGDSASNCDRDYDGNPGCDGGDEACQNTMMINDDRAANPAESDCAPVIRWSDALASVAYEHSRDMCQRGFFDHVNPDGDDPFDRMDDAGVTYVAAGENIAVGTDITGVIDQLQGLFMDEPECQANHRGNILNRDFTHVGVGVYHCEDGNLYLTQDFATAEFEDLRDDPHEYCG